MALLLCKHNSVLTLGTKRWRQGALSLQTVIQQMGNINFFVPKVNLFHNQFKDLDCISNEKDFFLLISNYSWKSSLAIHFRNIEEK